MEYRNINNLPVEILSLILDELDLKMPLRLTCSLWNKIIIGRNKIKVNIEDLIGHHFKIPFNDKTEPGSLFAKKKCNSRYYGLAININQFVFDDCSRFFKNLGRTVQVLTLGTQIQIKIEILFEILDCMKLPLREIVLDKCISPQDFNTRRLVSQFKKFCEKQNNALSKLASLYVNFRNLPITRHNPSSASTKVLMMLLNMNISSLRSLTIPDAGIVKNPLFFEVWPNMNIEKLVLDIPILPAKKKDIYDKIITNQITLKELTFRCFKNYNTYDVSLLAKSLPSLEILNLEYTGIDNTRSLKDLLKIKNLKNYNFNSTKITSFELKTFSIYHNINVKRIELRSKLMNDKLKDFLLCYPNLVELIITDCSRRSKNGRKDPTLMINDDSMHCIIKNLKKLKYLDLTGQEKITDFGFTGRNKKNVKIGPSLNELINLTFLNLQKCYKLSDSTLIYAIKFKQLRTLNLGYNYNVESEGIKCVIQNCPSLENVLIQIKITADDYVKILRNIENLKTFEKYCGECHEFIICKVKSINRNQILDPMYCRNCDLNTFKLKVKDLLGFKDLNVKTVEKIFENLKEHHYKKGEYIVRQDECCSNFFYIIKGSANIIKKDDSKKKIINIINAGDCFAVQAMQGDYIPTENVICNSSEGLICGVINKSTFDGSVVTVRPYVRKNYRYNYPYNYGRDDDEYDHQEYLEYRKYCYSWNDY